MASDQQVSPRAVLRAVLRAIAEVRRAGTRRVLEHLEQVEPDLASHLMEELSLVHRELARTAATAAEVRRVQRRVQSLLLVCITALRTAHHELWRERTVGRPLAELDPPPAAAGDGPSSA